MSRRDLLLLFPERRLGRELIEQAAGGYRWRILVLDADARRHFEELGRREGWEIVVRLARIPVEESVRELLDDGWEPLVGVINFVGTDWLSMRVDGSEARWSIEPARPEHVKLAAVDTVLAAVPEARRVPWINLAYGRHRPTPEGDFFCNTRYGLRGFRATVQLNPRLAEVRVRNVCMNYFLSKGARPHCRNCVSEEIPELSHRRISRRAMASFALELLERGATE